MLPVQRRMSATLTTTPKPTLTRPERPNLTRYKSHIVSESPLFRSYFSRRTYTAHQVRRVALFAIAAVSFTAAVLILHGYLATPHIPALQPLHDVHVAVQHAHTHPLHNAPPARPPKAKLSRTAAQPQYMFAAPADELGALVGFMAAFASNSLPAHVDPQQPLDPDLVLGFDPREQSMRGEVREAVKEAWRVNPVVVISELKTGNPPASREAKDIIQSLKLYPDPTIFEVDQRADVDVVSPLLKRLTGAEHFPVVIIGGEPIRTIGELRELKESGKLNELITAAGARINGKKKKGGRKH